MKNIIVSLFVTCALVFLVSSAYAAGFVSELDPVDQGPNAGETVSRAATYTFDMYPGAFFSTESTLYASYPGDVDTFVMNVTSRATITVTVADGYIQGDTICAGVSPAKKWCATSPAAVQKTVVLDPGTYIFRAAYLDSPGGYPAGYFVDVSGN